MGNRQSKGVPKAAARVVAPRGGGKTPTANVKLFATDDDECLTFSFRFADTEHQGSWSWPSQDESHEIMAFLCSIGSTPLNAIKQHTSNGHKKHHYQEFGSVCKEARDRLAMLRHDERFEDLFRFRVGAKKRLWGFLLGSTFYVLWWDRKHRVYPTEP